jgi:uroporphyrin-III C-methyltransferase/precorrin-2 dehydrogenase/sirohydrochlorin ferrochelatase
MMELGSLEGGTRPPAIAPLASLPVFHKIAGRKVVVAGSSPAALWKVELLSAAGADVLVFAGKGGPGCFDHVAQPAQRGSVTVLETDWRPVDLTGATLAIADLPREDAAAFAEAARASGAAVNVIDQPELSDFQFGSIVNRSPILVAVSTDGAAPVLGQSIRARIESILPLGLSLWAAAAKAWRPRLKKREPHFQARRVFWQRFASAAWSDPDRDPTNLDFERLLKARSPAVGRVTLVGAGPGDPELLTLKAVRALQSATVILYDRLVGPEVLELARREAVRIPVGKSGHGPSCKQSEINARMVELALAGETVVRLKGGDPLIFGRAAEEIAACRAAGIEVSVVPGISAAQGAAASLLVSLTERRHARRVQFVTGHGSDGKLPSDIDWTSVADRKATTVLYMPRKTLGEFVRRALAKGLDPATPAIAIASATLPHEASAAGPVIEIDNLAASLAAGAPVTVIIGWVGRRCLVTASAPLSFAKAVA